MKSLVPLARMRLLEVLVRSLAEGPAPVPALGSQADPWGLRAKPAPVRSALPTGTPQRLVPSCQVRNPPRGSSSQGLGEASRQTEACGPVRLLSGRPACCPAPASRVDGSPAPTPLGWPCAARSPRLWLPARSRCSLRALDRARLSAVFAFAFLPI